MKVNVRDRESGRLVTLDTIAMARMISAWVEILDKEIASGKTESFTLEQMKTMADNLDVIRQVVEGR